MIRSIIVVLCLIILCGCQSRVEEIGGNWRSETNGGWIDAHIDAAEKTLRLSQGITDNTGNHNSQVYRIEKVGNGYAVLDDGSRYVTKMEWLPNGILEIGLNRFHRSDRTRR